MDGIFGIGLPELIVILIIAGVVMGPKRIGQTARWLGKLTAQLQGISRQFVAQLNNELDAADDSGELKAALQEVRDLQQQMADLRKEVGAVATGAMKEGQTAVSDTKKAVEDVVKPPSLTPAPETNGNGSTPVPPPMPSLRDIPDDPDA